MGAMSWSFTAGPGNGAAFYQNGGLHNPTFRTRRKSRPAEWIRGWVTPRIRVKKALPYPTLPEYQKPAILDRCYTGSLETLYRLLYIRLGTAVAQCLRCCATNRKVGGSIPADVIGIFHWRNPSDRTMTLESTQPLTEMSTRSISWG